MIEVTLQIRIDYIHVALLHQFIDSPQCVLATSSRSKSIAASSEVTFENRLDYVHNRGLHDPITHCWNAQRPRFGRAWLWYVDSSYLRGLVRAGLQSVGQFPNRFRKLSLECSDRHVIRSGSAFIRRNLLKRRQQIPLGKHLVKQSEPSVSFHPLFEGRQHANGPRTRFHPSPSRQDLSGLLSQRHCRRCVFQMLGHSPSIFLVPFAPPALPGFIATMEPLTPVSHLPGSRQVSLCPVFDYPFIPSPTTLSPSEIAFARYPSASRTSACRGPGFAFVRQARQSTRPNRVHFMLRTERSPSVAPYPASRRRSYFRIQAGERVPEEDLHLSSQTPLQTHRTAGVSRLVISIVSYSAA